MMDGDPSARSSREAFSLRPTREIIKRLMDIAVSVVALAILLPLMIPLLWALRWLMGKPVLFCQQRVGLRGKSFSLYKIRTMRPDTPAYAESPRASRDPRVTRLGRYLRKHAIDEWPQFWNVLRGEMSLVGPRPEMPFLVAEYDRIARKRLLIKPGLTGLWQILAPPNEPIRDNIRYDLYYLRHWGLCLDLWILWRTVAVALRGRG